MMLSHNKNAPGNNTPERFFIEFYFSIYSFTYHEFLPPKARIDTNEMFHRSTSRHIVELRLVLNSRQVLVE